jgi:hypothetical protein
MKKIEILLCTKGGPLFKKGQLYPIMGKENEYGDVCVACPDEQGHTVFAQCAWWWTPEKGHHYRSRTDKTEFVLFSEVEAPEKEKKRPALKITGARLATAEESQNEIPMLKRNYSDWWWLKNMGDDDLRVLCEDGHGCIIKGGVMIQSSLYIRPVLEIENAFEAGYSVGDDFKFGKKEFVIISDDKAFCLTDIGRCVFNSLKNGNTYENSEVKNYIDDWFKQNQKTKKGETE